MALLVKDKIINFVGAGCNAYEVLVLLDIECTIVVPQVDWLHYIYNVSDVDLPADIDIEIIGNDKYHSISSYNEGI